MKAHTADLREVSSAILHEIQGVMGLARFPWAARLVSTLFGMPVHRLAIQLARLDEDAARCGLAFAAGNMLSGLIQSYRVYCPEAIPKQGPLLVASNHPGAYDILILAASLGRDDLKIISSDIAVFPRLPSIAPHFIPITDDPSRRMAAFRAGLRHLLEGGALLVFPRGNVEIDPAYSPRAAQILPFWSPSLELYLRKAPETRTVIAIVAGVLSPRWFNHPVLRLWKTPEQQQKVAEIMQVSEQLLLARNPPLSPRISFSPTYVFQQEDETSAQPGRLMQILTRAAQSQLEGLSLQAGPSEG